MTTSNCMSIRCNKKSSNANPSTFKAKNSLKTGSKFKTFKILRWCPKIIWIWKSQTKSRDLKCSNRCKCSSSSISTKALQTGILRSKTNSTLAAKSKKRATAYTKRAGWETAIVYSIKTGLWWTTSRTGTPRYNKITEIQMLELMTVEKALQLGSLPWDPKRRN